MGWRESVLSMKAFCAQPAFVTLMFTVYETTCVYEVRSLFAKRTDNGSSLAWVLTQVRDG
jgi:hypothetical protein